MEDLDTENQTTAPRYNYGDDDYNDYDDNFPTGYNQNETPAIDYYRNRELAPRSGNQGVIPQQGAQGVTPRQGGQGLFPWERGQETHPQQGGQGGQGTINNYFIKDNRSIVTHHTDNRSTTHNVDNRSTTTHHNVDNRSTTTHHNVDNRTITNNRTAKNLQPEQEKAIVQYKPRENKPEEDKATTQNEPEDSTQNISETDIHRTLSTIDNTYFRNEVKRVIDINKNKETGDISLQSLNYSINNGILELETKDILAEKKWEEDDQLTIEDTSENYLEKVKHLNEALEKEKLFLNRKNQLTKELLKKNYTNTRQQQQT